MLVRDSKIVLQSLLARDRIFSGVSICFHSASGLVTCPLPPFFPILLPKDPEPNPEQFGPSSESPWTATKHHPRKFLRSIIHVLSLPVQFNDTFYVII